VALALLEPPKKLPRRPNKDPPLECVPAALLLLPLLLMLLLLLLLCKLPLLLLPLLLSPALLLLPSPALPLGLLSWSPAAATLGSPSS
jgi:hypothetical protein